MPWSYCRRFSKLLEVTSLANIKPDLTQFSGEVQVSFESKYKLSSINIPNLKARTLYTIFLSYFLQTRLSRGFSINSLIIPNSLTVYPPKNISNAPILKWFEPGAKLPAKRVCYLQDYLFFIWQICTNFTLASKYYYYYSYNFFFLFFFFLQIRVSYHINCKIVMRIFLNHIWPYVIG